MARFAVVLCVALAVVALAAAQFDSQGQGGYGDQSRNLGGQGGFGGRGGQGARGQGGQGGQGGYGSQGGQRGFGQQQGFARQEDGSQKYRSRIFTEPDYDGYEANYPGGRASFKSFKNPESGAYRRGGSSRGQDAGADLGGRGASQRGGGGAGGMRGTYGSARGGGEAERF